MFANTYSAEPVPCVAAAVGHPIAKHKSGPTAAATQGTGSAEYVLANTLKGKKSTNEATTRFVLFIF